MRLEQTIRSTMTEAMDMDGRLDQLVRAGLMPTSSLPLLKRAISRMHAGMSLQGAERDVMNMFISSMMFIVLGDDTVFNKARAGAKGYATEETEDDGWYTHSQMHGSKKSEKHPKGISAAEWKSGIRWHHAKNKRINIKEAKEKTEYDYEGDMAMGQLKSIIANSQRMHDMLSDDTNLPEWVQSKITLAEDYISTASNYMQGEMNEEKMPFEGPYRKVGERKDKYGNPIKNVAKHLAKKAMNAQKNEEVEQIDEILPLVAGAAARYVAGKAGAGVVGRTVAGAATKYAVSKSMNKEEIDKDLEDEMKATRVTKKSMDDAKKTRERASGMKEEVEQVDEVSKATMGRYINKAKDSIDMTSYRSGVKDAAGDEYKPKNPLERKLTKRHKGISMAVKKLTKEDIDAVKQMNESYKTAFETALNEYGIKSPSELDESKRKEFFNHVDLEFKKGDN